MKKIMAVVCLLIMALVSNGCFAPIKEAGNKGQMITDDNGRIVNISQVPKRIVVLSPSFLELLEVFNAPVVGRAESTIAKIGVFAKDAKPVGFIFNINSEKVVELKPDLVVAYKGMHEKYLPIFESNNIPVIVLNLKTYEDVKHSLKVLGQVMQQNVKGDKVAKELDQKVQSAVAKLPKQTQRVAILHSSAQNVTLEQENSIAGCIAKLLQLENIVKSRDTIKVATGEQMTDKAPYSLEFLVEKDPQIIFITSMGSKEEIQARLENDATSSEAWQSITAVKNKAVYYLPDELFLLNPGLRYPEAVAYMADKLKK